MLIQPFMGGQDTQPKIKLTLCGTGILPVIENSLTVSYN